MNVNLGGLDDVFTSDLLQPVKISMRGIQAGVKAFPQRLPLGGTVTL